MIKVRKSGDRGHEDRGWLDTFHTFSFSSYFDPKHNKFRSLRVINEDWIQGHEGFGTHPHENMEIITYIIEGEIEHKDNMNNGYIIHPGEMQRMTAGKGVTHSELNPTDSITHLLQIWIYPDTLELDASYEQRDFSKAREPNALNLLASKTGRDGSLLIHQDVDLYGCLLDAGKKLTRPIRFERYAWIQIVKGVLELNGVSLKAGDGAAVSDELSLEMIADEDCEFLLFDLA